MSLLIWSVIAFLTGLVCSFAVPVLVGPALPVEWRDQLGDRFFAMSAAALGRGLILKRLHAGYDLVTSSFDPDKGEKATLDGEARHFQDVNNLMSRYYHRPFGLALEATDAIIDPAIVELGELDKRRHEEGDVLRTVDEDGTAVEARSNFVPVPLRDRILDVYSALHVIPGNADPGDVEMAEKFTEISQSGFNSPNFEQWLMIIVAYAASFILVFAALRFGPAVGGGEVNVPMALGVLA